MKMKSKNNNKYYARSAFVLTKKLTIRQDADQRGMGIRIGAYMKVFATSFINVPKKEVPLTSCPKTTFYIDGPCCEGVDCHYISGSKAK